MDVALQTWLLHPLQVHFFLQGSGSILYIFAFQLQLDVDQCLYYDEVEIVASLSSEAVFLEKI